MRSHVDKRGRCVTIALRLPHHLSKPLGVYFCFGLYLLMVFGCRYLLVLISYEPLATSLSLHSTLALTPILTSVCSVRRQSFFNCHGFFVRIIGAFAAYMQFAVDTRTLNVSIQYRFRHKTSNQKQKTVDPEQHLFFFGKQYTLNKLKHLLYSLLLPSTPIHTYLIVIKPFH